MEITGTIRRVSGGRYDVEVRDGEGDLIRSHSSRLVSGRNFRDAEKEIGVPGDFLRVQRGKVGPDVGDEIEFTWVPGTVETGFTVRVRGTNERAESAREFTGPDPLAVLRLAIDCVDYPAADPLIYWDGLDHLAAVDLDHHAVPYDDRPAHEQLRALADLVEPRARCVWSTHGRGLRLIYTARDGFTAGELAAVAALWLVSWTPSARVELKSITRHPAYRRGEHACGPVGWITGDCDLGAVKGWLGRHDASATEIQTWLADRGLANGRRYPHEKCPARPDEPGGRDPVTVHDGGIFCHRCAGVGVTWGSRKPGWFPFARLCGRFIDAALTRCLRRITHWEHAQHVVEDVTGLTGEVARLAYAAALRVLHGPDDPRVPLASVKGSDLIRLDTGWARLDGTPIVKGEPIVASIPAAHVITEKGTAAASMELVARLMQPGDLSNLGYSALTPVWGHRIYTYWLPPRSPLTIPIVMQTGALASDAHAAFRPKYIPPDRRDLDAAWRTLEAILPGLNREYLQLLLAARGCVEGELGLPPFIFTAGSTGAAKTATIMVAAAIAGDAATEITWSRDTDRLRQGLHNAKTRGTFAVFNEFLKDAGRGSGGFPAGNGVDGAISAMDFVLNLTPDSVSHSLYVGPVRLGTPPVCVWTDTAIPDFVSGSAQVARRIVGVQLTGSVRWEQSLTSAGHNKPGALRTEGNPATAHACDVILSHVIDRFFRQPPSFPSIARELGYDLLCDSPTARRVQDRIREFFDVVSAAPLAASHVQSRFGGRGWVQIPLVGESDFKVLWQSLCDATGRASMRISETDLAQLLGVPGPIAFETRSHGPALFGRFIRRTADRTVTYVNRELCPRVADAWGDQSWTDLLPPGV